MTLYRVHYDVHRQQLYVIIFLIGFAYLDLWLYPYIHSTVHVTFLSWVCLLSKMFTLRGGLHLVYPA